ncbi:MAG: helix-turn-helix transcriptional regulator [Ktedonobacteraceae bacterium]|nr:helix-turn-helix transcriptional regulator [Ktedonobacteraceae bacterium]
MKCTPREPESLLPLTPAVFSILLALADGERHGYGIMQEIVRSTTGKVRMGPGTLYGSIKRMIEDRLIEEADVPPSQLTENERRRYYRLTDFGLRVAQAEALRLLSLVQIARAKQILPG